MSGARRLTPLVLCVLAAAPAGAAKRIAAAKDAQADPDLAAQKSIYFPPAWPQPRTYRAAGIVLWTDSPVDGRRVVGQLQEVRRYLQQLLPAPGPATGPATRPASRRAPRPVSLAIYAESKAYHALWLRVGRHYDGRFGAVTTEGFSYRVFAAASYDGPEQFKRRRSVLCHEFTHAWLYQSRHLPNDGNWLTEGLATAVQLARFPDAGDRRQFARWMETGRMLPLKRLMDQKRIAPKDYWQAATLVELLIRRHGKKLPAIVAAFNQGKSAYAIVTDVLETDFLALQKQWERSVSRPTSAPTTRPTPSKRP